MSKEFILTKLSNLIEHKNVIRNLTKRKREKLCT
jgi:hypothetical protein